MALSGPLFGHAMSPTCQNTTSTRRSRFTCETHWKMPGFVDRITTDTDGRLIRNSLTWMAENTVVKARHGKEEAPYPVGLASLIVAFHRCLRGRKRPDSKRTPALRADSLFDHALPKPVRIPHPHTEAVSRVKHFFGGCRYPPAEAQRLPTDRHSNKEGIEEGRNCQQEREAEERGRLL